MGVELIYLTKDFYEDYPQSVYSEILHKNDRPYAVVFIIVDGLEFALPFQSHIRHQYLFITDSSHPNDLKGIDYTKAVLITSPTYKSSSEVRIRQNEFNALKGNEYKIMKGFKSYLNQYKKAAKRLDVKRNQTFCKYSSLQYFHKELGIEP